MLGLLFFGHDCLTYSLSLADVVHKPDSLLILELTSPLSFVDPKKTQPGPVSLDVVTLCGG